MNGLTAVSLFGGIGGIELALKRAGVRVVATAEIDKDCQGVLRRHFPETKLFNDVREVTANDLRAAGFVPWRGILTAGFPCQDLSVAGRRAGLAGARSGLFWDVVRLAGDLSPRWIVLENVPGLLSAVCSCPGDETCVDNGRAVRCGRWEKRDGKRIFVPRVTHNPQGGACPGGCMELHGGAMGTVLGALGELGYGFAYRVLDAQFFGVPQRRERVFIVGCLGDRAAPVEILLEPESGAGNPAPRGEKGADVAGTLGSRAGGSRTTDLDGHGAYVTEPGVAYNLTPQGHRVPGGWGGFSDAGLSVTETGHAATLDGRGSSTRIVTAATLQGGGRRGHRIDAEGAAGGHLIPVDLAQITSGENRSNPQPGDPMGTLAAPGQPAVAQLPREVTPLAVRGRDGGSQAEAGQAGDPMFTLRTPGGGSSHPMVSYALTSRNDRNDRNDREDNYVVEGSRHVPRLSAPLTGEGHDASEDGTGRRALIPMAFNPQTGGSQPRIGYGETPTALSCTQATGVQTAAAVRRLTPLERERLQGFPDGWTRWKVTEDGREVEQSDAARDRQTGNAVAVPVVQWIAERLVAAAAAFPVAEDLREAS